MFEMRTCYVNFAEHLQNAWNVNFLYEGAEGEWSKEDWRLFFRQIKAFGYTDFQCWIPPTLCKKGADRDRAAGSLAALLPLCHGEGLTFHVLMAANTIGVEWFFACPNLPRERHRILEFWSYYADLLRDADYFTVFPGDPGGCNRNGCDHTTFLRLAAEIAWMIKDKAPRATVILGTWGTPFTGWGGDLRETKNYDGTFASLLDPANHSPEVPCHIWNGTAERARRCGEDLLALLPLFPEDTAVSINLGFNPDAEPAEGFDARPLAAEIAKTHRVVSWDYAASEGELVCYPHFRLDKFARKRREELSAAPYYGAICYTMSPRLNQLTLYAAAQIMQRPTAEGDTLAAEFTEKVFGDGRIGPLMRAFEIVPGWGYEPTPYRRDELVEMLDELIGRLERAKGKRSALPIFPDEETYRLDLLWHAENFREMLRGEADRDEMRERYRRRALSIYEKAPLAVDERSALSALGYSKIGENLK